MDAILSNSPLSSGYRARLNEALGSQPEVLNFAELRQLPLGRLVRRLRTMRYDRIVVPTEDQQSAALNVVLFLVAYATRARRIMSASPELALETVSRARTAWLLFRTVIASIQSRVVLARARRDLAALSRSDRITVDRPLGNRGLFLNANLWFGVKAGGSVGHISGVINAFDDLGYEMTFASAGGRMMVRKSVPMTLLQPPRYFGVPWEANYYRFNYSVVDQLAATGAQRPIDFIYQRMSLANFSGVALSRQLGVPLIVEYNGSEVWVSRHWGRPLRYDKLGEDAELVSIRHAHLVVAISDVLRDELIERGVPPERVVTYPNCIDETLIDPGRFSAAKLCGLRRSYGIADDAIVVTFLGTFGRWHGTELLAEAISKLAREHPDWCRASRVHFLFIGDGLRMPEVKRALGPLANGPMVTLAGIIPQEEAPMHLAMSDILVSPHAPNADGSRFFGSPTKLFEYLAMGKAILASDLDQIGDILRGSDRLDELAPEARAPSNGAVALLVDPGDVDELAAGLRFLVDRPEWRSAIGLNARTLALSRYTWKHHVTAIVERANALGLLMAPIGPSEPCEARPLLEVAAP